MNTITKFGWSLKSWLQYGPLWRQWAWIERVWYCHHNAAVLADMEHRLSCVLTSTTRGMSKPYYTWEAMRGEINAFQNEQYDEAYEEGVKDTRAECAAEIAALKSEIDDLEMEIRVMGECE